jgi:hypothetical protein
VPRERDRVSGTHTFTAKVRRVLVNVQSLINQIVPHEPRPGSRLRMNRAALELELKEPD